MAPSHDWILGVSFRLRSTAQSICLFRIANLVLVISGFTPDTPPQSQVLNDYTMKNTLTSFSFGVGYVLGFGKYKRGRTEDDK